MHPSDILPPIIVFLDEETNNVSYEKGTLSISCSQLGYIYLCNGWKLVSGKTQALSITVLYEYGQIIRFTRDLSSSQPCLLFASSTRHQLHNMYGKKDGLEVI